MNDDLDAMLRDPLLQPPADFALRVLKSLPVSLPVQTSASPAGRPAAPHRFGLRLRRLAARTGWVGAGVLGFLLGLDQLAAFVFGLWLAGAAL